MKLEPNCSGCRAVVCEYAVCLGVFTVLVGCNLDRDSVLATGLTLSLRRLPLCVRKLTRQGVSSKSLTLLAKASSPIRCTTSWYLARVCGADFDFVGKQISENDCDHTHCVANTN